MRKLFELFLAILNFLLNFALWIICIPFVPIIWAVQEIKRK